MPKAKIDKVIWPWFALCVVLVIACAGLTLGYLGERNAAQAKSQSLATAQCVNTVLSLRQAPAAQDSAIYSELWGSVGALLNAQAGAAQQQAYASFLALLAKDQPTLNANQIFRQQHPLGRC